MTNPVHRNHEVAGGPIPPKCEIIEIRLAELNQIFNRMDPSPFQDKDLDPKAEEFIVGWAREVSRNAPLALSVHLDCAKRPRCCENRYKNFSAIVRLFRDASFANSFALGVPVWLLASCSLPHVS